MLHLTVEQTRIFTHDVFGLAAFVTACQAACHPEASHRPRSLCRELHGTARAGALPDGGLGLAFGSCFVACIIWFLLTVPFAAGASRDCRALSAQPDDFGIMCFSPWCRSPTRRCPDGLGKKPVRISGINLLAGAVAVAVLVCVTLWGGKQFRRVAMLVGLVLGTLVYALSFRFRSRV